MPNPLSSSRYQRTRAQWIAALPGPVACDLCGLPVDPTIPGRYPWGITVEHRVPVRRLIEMADGDWALLVSLVCDTQWWGAAHRGCQNRQGGASSVERVPRAEYVPSREW